VSWRQWGWRIRKMYLVILLVYKQYPINRNTMEKPSRMQGLWRKFFDHWLITLKMLYVRSRSQEIWKKWSSMILRVLLKHMNNRRRKRKKQEVLEEALQTKMTIKEDKVMYAQCNLRRGWGPKVTVTVIVVETTMKRKDKRTSKIDVDEATIVEDVVALIIKILNVTIAKNMNIIQRIANPKES